MCLTLQTLITVVMHMQMIAFVHTPHALNLALPNGSPTTTTRLDVSRIAAEVLVAARADERVAIDAVDDA